jgi:cysteine sulfinate desulfinase/cysteine desulfurase-like protein
LARGAVRVSLGKDNDQAQVERFLQALQGEIFSLRRLAAAAV